MGWPIFTHGEVEAGARVRSRTTCDRGETFGARFAVLVPALLIVSYSGLSDSTPDASSATLSLPTAPPETDPREPPPETIPPGFDFPVLRTGSMCFTHMDVDGGYSGDFNGMAAKLETEEGLLEDGRTYVGPLVKALRALDLEPIGVEVGDVAYGIGLVMQNRAMPQLPAGTVWTPRLSRFELADGRTGWTLNGEWIAVVDDDCGVLPTTPG